MTKAVNNQLFQKMLRKRFDPTNDCLRKAKHLFVGRVGELLAKAESPKGKKEALKLCLAVHKLLQSTQFKTPKGCDKAYSALWKKFESTCAGFAEINKAEWPFIHHTRMTARKRGIDSSK